jgi:Co/Zn/Cd efflux system component
MMAAHIVVANRRVLGALMIGSWSFALIRDTSAILLDMNLDRRMSDNIRGAIESEGDQIADLYVWRLGPGHLGAILSVVTPTDRRESFYRAKLGRFRSLSHLTIEVKQAAQGQLCAVTPPTVSSRA